MPEFVLDVLFGGTNRGRPILLRHHFVSRGSPDDSTGLATELFLDGLVGVESVMLFDVPRLREVAEPALARLAEKLSGFFRLVRLRQGKEYFHNGEPSSSSSASGPERAVRRATET